MQSMKIKIDDEAVAALWGHDTKVKHARANAS